MPGLEWGRAELVVEATDAPLRAKLAADENLARASAGRMQASLSKVAVGQTEMTAGSVKGTAAFSALSQASGVLQSRAGAVAGQVGAVAIALQEATASASMLQTGIVGLGVAVGTFYAGMKLAELVTGRMSKEADELFSKTNERIAQLEQQAMKEQALIDAAEGQLDAALGLTKAEQIRNMRISERAKAILIEINRETEVANAIRTAEAAELARNTAIETRRVALENEISVLTGEVSKYELIEDAELRLLTIERDRAAEQKRIADDADREAKVKKAAEASRIAALGPQTETDARRFVLDALGDMRTVVESNRLLLMQFESVVATLGITDKEAEALRAKLGLAAGDMESTGATTGSIRLAAFAGTGVGATRVAGGERERREKERTDAAKMTERHTKRTADQVALAFSRGSR